MKNPEIKTASRVELIRATFPEVCKVLYLQCGYKWTGSPIILKGRGNFTPRQILEATNGMPATVIFYHCDKWQQRAGSWDRCKAFYIDRLGGIILQDWRGCSLNNFYRKSDAHEARKNQYATYFIIAQEGSRSGAEYVSPDTWGRTDKNARYIIDSNVCRRWSEAYGGASYLGQVGGHIVGGGNARKLYDLNSAASKNKRYTDTAQIIDASGYPVALWREELRYRAEALRRERSAAAAVRTADDYRAKFDALKAEAAKLPALVGAYIARASLADFGDYEKRKKYTDLLDGYKCASLDGIAEAIERHEQRTAAQRYTNADEVKKAIESIRGQIAAIKAATVAEAER